MQNLPHGFVGASFDEESAPQPNIVSPSGSQAKITMFDETSYRNVALRSA